MLPTSSLNTVERSRNTWMQSSRLARAEAREAQEGNDDVEAPGGTRKHEEARGERRRADDDAPREAGAGTPRRSGERAPGQKRAPARYRSGAAAASRTAGGGGGQEGKGAEGRNGNGNGVNDEVA